MTKKAKNIEPEIQITSTIQSKAPLVEKPNKLKEIRKKFIEEERIIILAVFEKHDWNQTHAAQSLGTLLASLRSALRRHPDLKAMAIKNARPGAPKKTNK